MARKISNEEMNIMITGGIYYDRLPGRGITIRREYRPLKELIKEGINNLAKAMNDMAISINEALNNLNNFGKTYEEVVSKEKIFK